MEDDIGTHSIYLGAAMAIYLDEVPVYTVMLITKLFFVPRLRHQTRGA